MWEEVHLQIHNLLYFFTVTLMAFVSPVVILSLLLKCGFHVGKTVCAHPAQSLLTAGT